MSSQSPPLGLQTPSQEFSLAGRVCAMEHSPHMVGTEVQEQRQIIRRASAKGEYLR